MKNMDVKNKKSVIITNIITNKWKRNFTNKWKRIDYGNFRMDFNIDVYIHNWMLCWNYCFGTFKE